MFVIFVACSAICAVRTSAAFSATCQLCTFHLTPNNHYTMDFGTFVITYVGLVRLKLSPVKFVLFTLLLLAISISIETGHSAIRFCNKTEFETFMTLL